MRLLGIMKLRTRLWLRDEERGLRVLGWWAGRRTAHSCQGGAVAMRSGKGPHEEDGTRTRSLHPSMMPIATANLKMCWLRH